MLESDADWQLKQTLKILLNWGHQDICRVKPAKEPRSGARPLPLLRRRVSMNFRELLSKLPHTLLCVLLLAFLHTRRICLRWFHTVHGGQMASTLNSFKYSPHSFKSSTKFRRFIGDAGGSDFCTFPQFPQFPSFGGWGGWCGWRSGAVGGCYICAHTSGASEQQL